MVKICIDQYVNLHFKMISNQKYQRLLIFILFEHLLELQVHKGKKKRRTKEPFSLLHSKHGGFHLSHRFDTVTNPLHSGSRSLNTKEWEVIWTTLGLIIDVYSTHFQFLSNFKCFREIICKD